MPRLREVSTCIGTVLVRVTAPVSRSSTGRAGAALRLSPNQRISAMAGFPYTPPELMPGEGALYATARSMLIGNARCSTSNQDLTAQRHALHALGVDADMVHVDHGFTGTKRDRPGLKKDLAECRNGDTFVVTKLDRLARSLPDAKGYCRRTHTQGRNPQHRRQHLRSP